MVCLLLTFPIQEAAKDPNPQRSSSKSKRSSSKTKRSSSKSKGSSGKSKGSSGKTTPNKELISPTLLARAAEVRRALERDPEEEARLNTQVMIWFM